MSAQSVHVWCESENINRALSMQWLVYAQNHSNNVKPSTGQFYYSASVTHLTVQYLCYSWFIHNTTVTF